MIRWHHKKKKKKLLHYHYILIKFYILSQVTWKKEERKIAIPEARVSTLYADFASCWNWFPALLCTFIEIEINELLTYLAVLKSQILSLTNDTYCSSVCPYFISFSARAVLWSNFTLSFFSKSTERFKSFTLFSVLANRAFIYIQVKRWKK